MYIFTKQNPIVVALEATLVTAIVAAMGYLAFEPGALLAATDTNTFTVNQTIGAEIAFSTTQGNLTMSNTIGGATGGEATSTAVVAVTTNDSSGYTIAISFEDAVAMQHAGALDTIDNYGTTTPDLTMSLGAALSGFAFSVSSTNAVSAFTTCAAGPSDSVDQCFMMHGSPTTNYTIVDSNAVATDEETQVGFKVIVAPSSGIVNGEYYATTTLTAATKS